MPRFSLFGPLPDASPTRRADHDQLKLNGIAMEPGFHCVRTHAIWGFHGLPAGPARSDLTV
jgi:hypothetical protein